MGVSVNIDDEGMLSVNLNGENEANGTVEELPRQNLNLMSFESVVANKEGTAGNPETENAREKQKHLAEGLSRSTVPAAKKAAKRVRIGHMCRVI